MMCEHREGRKCKAFPNGIPHVISSDEVLHLRKLNGQTGDFLFKPKDHHKNAEDRINKFEELFDKQNEIKKEIPELTIDIVNQSMKSTNWQKSIFDINRKPRGISDSRNEELHVFANNGKILTGEIPKVSRFCHLHHQLLICENIENQYTTMRTIVYPDGNCKFEFTKEWSNYRGINDKNELERILDEVRLSKNSRLKRLSLEEAESKVKKIIELENPNFPVSDNLISIMIEKKGYILLRIEIKKIRLKNKIPDFVMRKT